MRASTARWSAASKPRRRGASSSSTFWTARATPFPPHADASPSRSSTASNAPVEAPDGTAARPNAPDSRTTSTSTVGFPRESSTCRARTSEIRLATQLRLRLVVVPVLRLELERRPPLAALGRELLRPLHPRDELLRRPPQGELRVDVEPHRDVDREEEDVTDLVDGTRVGLLLGARRADPRTGSPDPGTRSRPLPHGAAPCGRAAARAAPRARRGRCLRALPARA